MKFCHFGRFGAVLILSIGMSWVALFGRFVPTPIVAAHSSEVGVATHLLPQITNTLVSPLSQPTTTITLTPTSTLIPTPTLTPVPTSAPTLSPTETSSPSPTEQIETDETGLSLPFPLPLLGLLCLLPLLLILAILVIWRRSRQTAKRAQALNTRPVPPPVPPRISPPRLVHGATIWNLQPEQTLGHSPESICVIDSSFDGHETVSAIHARLYQEKDRWFIEDRASLNGVYVNAIRTGRNVLHDGDKVRLGAVEFTFYAGGQEVLR